jgi:hypothetical protein
VRSGQITEVSLLDHGNGLISKEVLETNAYGGCYIDRKDFAAREEVEPGVWRMYDHDDEAIPEAGPLYQYADAAIVARMQELLS